MSGFSYLMAWVFCLASKLNSSDPKMTYFSLICSQNQIRYWDLGSNEKANIPFCIYKNIKEEFIPENFCFITDIGEFSSNYSCFKGFSKNIFKKIIPTRSKGTWQFILSLNALLHMLHMLVLVRFSVFPSTEAFEQNS